MFMCRRRPKAAVGGPLGGVRPARALTAAPGSLLTDPRGRVAYLTKYTETLAAGPEIRSTRFTIRC
jgi:hypothetical protein